MILFGGGSVAACGAALVTAAGVAAGAATGTAATAVGAAVGARGEGASLTWQAHVALVAQATNITKRIERMFSPERRAKPAPFSSPPPQDPQERLGCAAMNHRARLAGAGALLLVLGLGAACSRKASPGTNPSSTSASEATAATGPVVTVMLAYGSEKKSWLTDAITRFNTKALHLPSGELIRIEGQAVGSGAAVDDLTDGTVKAHAWAPASSMYKDVFQRAWTTHQGALGSKKEPLDAGKSLALSPVVLAMWKPMAQALGFPDKPVGWADVLALSTDPKGWASKGHAEWGSFKFGHTHPTFSNSGTLTVLAEAYAALAEKRGLTKELLAKPKVAPYLESIEQSIVHYGKSTGFFADKMLSRGPSFLSAAVLYENLVVESYLRTDLPPHDLDLVSVYPKEGTFWIDNPFYVLDAPWSDAPHQQAAAQFRDFLLAPDEQATAMTRFGFRPADPQIAIAAPLDAAHGVNPKEPQTLLEVPSTDVVEAALSLWGKVKKTVDISFVFDRSGSMAGEPLRQAKQGALDFLSQLDGRDRVSILMFNDQVPEATEPLLLSSARDQLNQAVNGTFADGGTALYDAIAKAHDKLGELAKQDPKRTFAVVAMTDGKDEHSKQTLDQVRQLVKQPTEMSESGVRLFTIAYGAQADTKLLADLAEAGGGASFKGDSSSIRQVYRDLAAFF
jgi:Ca-activated chloride channel family protein